MEADMWRALHIFLHRSAEEVDEFIVGCLAPAVARRRAEGEITTWFFIRYWVGGPHIRIRLRIAPKAGADPLERIRAEAAEYLAARPGRTPLLDPDEHYRRVGRVSGGAEEFGWHHDGDIVEL